MLGFLQLEQVSGISRYTWRLWTHQGKLASYKLGRRVVVDERDYRAFLEARRREVGELGEPPKPLTLEDEMFRQGR